ncbi:MAG: zinc ribbon domain-containing protein, partial [Gammaproteobacteria bacterium]
AAVWQSFLHNVDLPFHEFGHVLFRPFGEWMMYLGGSLFQCLLPLLLAGYFVFRQGQPFSAAVCLWWCGQNFIDVAPYIGDARALALPLIGEFSEEAVDLRAFRHDWHNVLGALGWLNYDQRLAALAKGSGVLLMLLSWVWGGLLLRIQYANLAGDVHVER